MARKPEKEPKTSEQMSVVDAVETLSTLADLEFDAEIGVTQEHQIVVRDRPLTFRTVHWVNQGNRKATVGAVRETFRVVLDYLRQFYEEKPSEEPSERAVDSIQNIMLLVGDAADNLDRYTQLFRKADQASVTELKEYKDLQAFYRDTLMTQKGEEASLQELFSQNVPRGKTGRRRRKPSYVGKKSLKDGRHVILDMDSLRRDTEYELMLLRKVGGERFFSRRLLRNLRLVCDFGEAFGQPTELDPLIQTERWLDRSLNHCAQQLLAGMGPALDEFYSMAGSKRDWELVGVTHRALMALFLASNPRNLIRNNPVKSCTRYFRDFQYYFRQALNSLDFHRLSSRDPHRVGALSDSILDSMHSICRTLFIRLEGIATLIPVMDLLIQHAFEVAGRKLPHKWPSLSGALRDSWDVMAGMVHQLPAGPIRKTLGLVHRYRMQAFDPYLLQIIPSRCFDFYVNSRKIAFCRIPSPTWQEYIHKAMITPEFRACMDSYRRARKRRHHLIVNLQDSTSWKDHARCKALQEMAEHEDYSKVLTVVTLNKNSDFYHQDGPYQKMSEADLFIDTLLEQLRGDGTGYHFPERYRKPVLGKFLDHMVAGVHELFFEGRNSLSRVERRDLIELVYFLVTLKCLEVGEPTSCSFTCKDSLDSGSAALAKFYGLVRLIQGEKWGKPQIRFVQALLFSPALMHRDRLIQHERFDHCVTTLARAEECIEEMGEKAFMRRYKALIDKHFDRSLFKQQVEPVSPQK